MVTQLIELYEYDENGLFTGTYIANTIQEAQRMMNDPTLKKNITNIKPTKDLLIYPNISPKFDDGHWIENTSALEEKDLPKKKSIKSLINLFKKMPIED